MNARILATLLVLASPYGSALEHVEVNAQRADSDTPISFSDINTSRLAGVNETVEPSFFLSKFPSITQHSDSGGYQGYSYLRLRGIDQTRINMTLDGVPLNEPEDQGVYFSNYPGILGSLESVQIQRGVGIAQNGTASFAGNIQLQSINLTREAASSLTAGAGAFDSGHISGKYLSGFNDGKSFFAQAAAVHSDGYKYHSGNDSQSLFASSLLEDEVGTWRIAGFKGSQSNELAWIGVSKAELEHDRRSNGNTRENDHFEQTLLYVIRTQTLSDQLQASVTAYDNELNGNYDFDLNNFLGVPSTGQLLNYAFDSSFTGLIAVANYRTQFIDLSAGIHANKYERTHTGSDNETGRLFRNTGFKDSFSAFLKSNYSGEAWSWFMNFQYRTTDFSYRGSVPLSDMTWYFFNPLIGFSYAINDNAVAYYSIGKTGREPTRTDLFGGNENLERDQYGEPNLFLVKPEYVVDQELGVRYQAGPMVSSINVFWMDFKDEITLQGQLGANGLPLTQTVDKSIRSGLEMDNVIHINPNLELTASASLSNSKINGNGEAYHQALSPRQIANIGIDYSRGYWVFGIDYRYQSEAYLDLANTQKLNSYSTFNGAITYTVYPIEFRLQANNILNKQYSSSGSVGLDGQALYFVAPPANIYGSVRVTF